MAQFLPMFARENMLSNTGMDMDSMSTDLNVEALKKLNAELVNAGKTQDEADNFIRYLRQNSGRKYAARAMIHGNVKENRAPLTPSQVYDHFVTTTEHGNKAVEAYVIGTAYPEPSKPAKKAKKAKPAKACKPCAPKAGAAGLSKKYPIPPGAKTFSHPHHKDSVQFM